MKSDRINIRVSAELKEELQRAADRENRTLSNFAEKILKETAERIRKQDGE